jgi:hypothetical protein
MANPSTGNQTAPVADAMGGEASTLSTFTM